LLTITSLQHVTDVAGLTPLACANLFIKQYIYIGIYMEGNITKFIFYVQKQALNFQNFFWNTIVNYPLFSKSFFPLSILYFLAQTILQWRSIKSKYVATLYNKAIWFINEDLYWTNSYRFWSWNHSSFRKCSTKYRDCFPVPMTNSNPECLTRMAETWNFPITKHCNGSSGRFCSLQGLLSAHSKIHTAPDSSVFAVFINSYAIELRLEWDF
jgi:hypothetical protein